MKIKTRKLALAAVIAAIYAATTLMLSFQSFGLIQYRLAEALTVLPYFSVFPVWGIFIGCLIANLLSPYGVLDIIFGTSASLIAALMTYSIGRSNIRYKKYLAPVPPIVINAVIVGSFLSYSLKWPLLLAVLQVGWGQLISCYLLGFPLLAFVERNKILKKYFADDSF